VIVLDTNIVSEFFKPEPRPDIVSWVDQLEDRSAITAVTAAELLEGVRRLRRGRKRQDLALAIASVLDDEFVGRILPFDAEAAVHYAEVVTDRSASGRPIDRNDAQIAAICRARGLSLATRNVRDFAGTGVELIDPWAAEE
jgi:predicted nucleic acid-binding protein